MLLAIGPQQCSLAFFTSRHTWKIILPIRHWGEWVEQLKAWGDWYGRLWPSPAPSGQLAPCCAGTGGKDVRQVFLETMLFSVQLEQLVKFSSERGVVRLGERDCLIFSFGKMEITILSIVRKTKWRNIYGKALQNVISVLAVTISKENAQKIWNHKSDLGIVGTEMEHFYQTFTWGKLQFWEGLPLSLLPSLTSFTYL